MTRLPGEPFSLAQFEQLLREDPARRDIPEDALADLIESNPQSPLPTAVRHYLVAYLREQALARKRGRRPKRHPATQDFLLTDAAELYHEALARFQREQRATAAEARRSREILPRGGPSPSQRALEEVCEQMKDDLGPISPERLHNLLSESGWIGRPNRKDDETES
jgi:hypothetical protein